jgi:nitrate reductase NapAB chaperone NapD
MAIASFLVLVDRESLDKVRRSLSGRDDLMLHAAQDLNHLVVVAERPSNELHDVEREFKGLGGVLAVSTAYLNIEDELEAAGSVPVMP